MRVLRPLAYIGFCIIAGAVSFAVERPLSTEIVGLVRQTGISEISGAATSKRNPETIYTVNDSQNSASLHLITPNGARIAKIRVNGAENHDWEDLDAFLLDGKPYLLIADTGDNGGLRSSLNLIIVEEPTQPSPKSVDIAWQIEFKLPEGPRDIEAVSVDTASNSVLLIAKRHFPRVLYQLPLQPERSEKPLLATRIGTFDTLPTATAIEKKNDPKFGRFRGDITALALDPAGRFALVLSYRDLYFYPRTAGEDWLQALQKTPVRLHVPATPQAEAIALDAASHHAYVLSERLLAPIYRVPLPTLHTEH